MFLSYTLKQDGVRLVTECGWNWIVSVSAQSRCGICIWILSSTALVPKDSGKTQDKQNKHTAIVDIRLRPRCAFPSPPFRPIGCIASAQNFLDSYLRLPGILTDLFCCMTLLAIERSFLQRTRKRRLHWRLPMLLNARTTPKIAAYPWDFIILPEEDRDTATGNMHKKLVKIRRVTREICSRTYRQTDTQAWSLQYFATAPTVKQLV